MNSHYYYYKHGYSYFNLFFLFFFFLSLIWCTGADVNAKDSKGNRPLHTVLAVEQMQDTELVRISFSKQMTLGSPALKLSSANLFLSPLLLCCLQMWIEDCTIWLQHLETSCKFLLFLKFSGATVPWGSS